MEGGLSSSHAMCIVAPTMQWTVPMAWLEVSVHKSTAKGGGGALAGLQVRGHQLLLGNVRAEQTTGEGSIMCEHQPW